MIQLNQLKYIYSKYDIFWNEWKYYKFNGLSIKDITMIDVFKRNNFSIDLSNLEVFYTTEQIVSQLIIPLTEKLLDSYADYKEWISIRFQLSLIKNAILYGLDEFFETPIDQLYISKEYKIYLKRFNCRTIQELSDRYNDLDYVHDCHFDDILKFKQFNFNALNIDYTNKNIHVYQTKQ